MRRGWSTSALASDLIGELSDDILRNLVVITVQSSDNPADEASRGSLARTHRYEEQAQCAFWENISRCCKTIKKYLNADDIFFPTT
jgi:hypothetical protein